MSGSENNDGNSLHSRRMSQITEQTAFSSVGLPASTYQKRLLEINSNARLPPPSSTVVTCIWRSPARKQTVLVNTHSLAFSYTIRARSSSTHDDIGYSSLISLLPLKMKIM